MPLIGAVWPPPSGSVSPQRRFGIRERDRADQQLGVGVLWVLDDLLRVALLDDLAAWSTMIRSLIW